MDSRRQEKADATFKKLDKDGSGLLSKEEFRTILSNISPTPVEASDVDKAFKKAKIEGDEMDIHGFYRWADKKLGKVDDGTFDGVMSMLAPVVLVD